MKQKLHNANVGEFTLRATAENIVKFAEGKGYEFSRMKDEVQAHYYWQIADHWKRVEA